MVLPNDSSITPRSYPTQKLGDDFGVKNPMERFNEWFEDAVSKNVLEPDAMTLSTMGSRGVNARTLALRGVTESSLLVYTNFGSVKSSELKENPQVAVTFYWREVFRQVRIKAVAKKASKEQNDLYFASRPRGSQVGAWISRQSNPLSSREELENAYHQFDKDLGDSIERPPFWGGYELIPCEWEFMQGHLNRLHDRFSFTQNDDGSFSSQRLWP